MWNYTISRDKLTLVIEQIQNNFHDRCSQALPNHGNGMVSVTEIRTVIVQSPRTSGRPKEKSSPNAASRLRLMKFIQTGVYFTLRETIPCTFARPNHF